MKERECSVSLFCPCQVVLHCDVISVPWSVFQFIPSRDGARKQDGGVRPLSASEEKKIDEAIELANSFAQLRTSDHMISSPGSAAVDGAVDMDPGGSGTESPRPRSMFSLRSKRSPRQEKKTYSEEIASIASSDLSEDMTPEAQEAYNMLVGSGSKKTRTHSTGRERRIRRSTDPQDKNRSLPRERDSDSVFSARSSGRSRNINQNIREPQGIPGRSLRSSRDSGEDTGDVDVNPLRRLRDSQVGSGLPKSRHSSQATQAEGLTNGHGKQKVDDDSHANLNANLHFFAKLKEQEQELGRDIMDSPRDNGFHDDEDNADRIQNGELCGVTSQRLARMSRGSSSMEDRSDTSFCSSPRSSVDGDIEGVVAPRLPPRIPLKTGTPLNVKPVQRKYPLDLSLYGTGDESPRKLSDSEPQVIYDTPPQTKPCTVDGTNRTEVSSRSGAVTESSKPATAENDSTHQDFHEFRNTKNITSIFSPSQANNNNHLSSLPNNNDSSARPQPALSVKHVQLSATDLGLDDRTDLFWSKTVDFDTMATGNVDEHDEVFSDAVGQSFIPGRYKTSGTVSYEDLMEFALDGPDPSPSSPSARFVCVFFVLILSFFDLILFFFSFCYSLGALPSFCDSTLPITTSNLSQTAKFSS